MEIGDGRKWSHDRYVVIDKGMQDSGLGEMQARYVVLNFRSRTATPYTWDGRSGEPIELTDDERAIWMHAMLCPDQVKGEPRL
jgi:hypothetical protein